MQSSRLAPHTGRQPARRTPGPAHRAAAGSPLGFHRGPGSRAPRVLTAFPLGGLRCCACWKLATLTPTRKATPVTLTAKLLLCEPSAARTTQRQLLPSRAAGSAEGGAAALTAPATRGSSSPRTGRKAVQGLRQNSRACPEPGTHRLHSSTLCTPVSVTATCGY